MQLSPDNTLTATNHLARHTVSVSRLLWLRSLWLWLYTIKSVLARR